ncbi:hypothetical protein NUU61_003412 [Penicillium alfredii]|uniref:Uncharacterized protein n=1 Tax=Penicillium alfredii TaxID=1506179 RepID=A0A9W9KGW7_9EURO|nr:uncharacterized protein NUU61_003412 [Penicillium alfredii]KAJ5106065.1 hypothetical protein NUU61_003412 [Penicillium alfredii]
MRLLPLLCLFTATAWTAQPERRETTAPGFNLASISGALQNLTATETATANFHNISPPPRSLIPEILAVVPVSVLWELINPQQRSSLASQFKAGSTPAWYQSLPADVKSYMSVVRSQVSAGALTASETSTATSAATTSQSGAPTTTSSQGMAAQPTGLTASVIGALGVLGLALAL